MIFPTNNECITWILSKRTGGTGFDLMGLFPQSMPMKLADKGQGKPKFRALMGRGDRANLAAMSFDNLTTKI